jgi:hypothetical protein
MEDFGGLLQEEFGLLSRRLRGMAMVSRGIVPNLMISQRLVDRVVKATEHFIEDETGETMVGLVVDTDEPEKMPTLYVLDAIAPDDSVIRRSTMFEQGDEMQGDIFLWLMDNWNTYLELGKDMSGKPIKEEWKTELKHLGDWHKQPGFMIQPSGGDLMTALRIMDDEEQGFEYLLVPIVTLGHPSVTDEEGAQVNYFTVPQADGTSLRMDWWYIHRDVRVFQPITPKIIPVNELPDLTPYPWHILRRDLLDEEVGQLQDDGKFLIGSTSILMEIDGDLPLEICFIVGQAGSGDVYLVITDWNYPKAKPRIYIAPFTGVDTSMYIYDIFTALYANAKPAPEVDYQWDEDSSYIVDYLAVIEQHLGKRPKNSQMPWEREGASQPSVSIAVEVEGEEDGQELEDEVEDAKPAVNAQTKSSKRAAKKAKSRKASTSKKEDS